MLLISKCPAETWKETLHWEAPSTGRTCPFGRSSTPPLDMRSSRLNWLVSSLTSSTIPIGRASTATTLFRSCPFRSRRFSIQHCVLEVRSPAQILLMLLLQQHRPALAASAHSPDDTLERMGRRSTFKTCGTEN